MPCQSTTPGAAPGKFGVVKAVATLEEVFADATIDATHLNSGIPDHTRQAIANLEAGKHVACTIPMATSLDDISPSSVGT
jgi:predicted dehydrogenase